MDFIQEECHETADPLHSCTAIELLVSTQPQTDFLIQTSHLSDLSICTLPTRAMKNMDNTVKPKVNRKSELPLQGKIKGMYQLYPYSLRCRHTSKRITTQMHPKETERGEGKATN